MTEPGAHTVPPSTVVLQPWWQNTGYGGVATAAMPEETTSKPPASNVNDRRQGAKGGPSQQPDGSSNEDVDGRKRMQDVEREAGSSRSCEQGQQHMQSVTSTMPPMMPDYFLPHTQLELGQTIACAPYSYTDPYYGGTVASYETQALVHPQLLGMPQTRMALPLDMAEEPVCKCQAIPWNPEVKTIPCQS